MKLTSLVKGFCPHLISKENNKERNHINLLQYSSLFIENMHIV